jgi:glycosyltransferase involved in cell wall biosynthesis
MKEKIIAVIPALNEEKTIGKIIADLKKHSDEIIVVDDASTDKTSQIARENSATVIKHQTNQGYDKTIDDGFKEAAKKDATIIFTFDADGQHNPDDIPKILNPIRENQADIVAGVRPRHQRISERIFANYSKKKIGISDPLCGIKAYDVEIYKKIGYFDKLNSIGTELLFNAHKNGYRIKEIEIEMNKREDHSRFGNFIGSNFKIIGALSRIKKKFR